MTAKLSNCLAFRFILRAGPPMPSLRSKKCRLGSRAPMSMPPTSSVSATSKQRIILAREAPFLLGELNLYHSKIPEAVAEFEKELQLNPGYAPAYYKLADAYSRIQKFDEAEKLLQRSIWLDSTSTGPYILMGKVLEKKGETELAIRTLQRALAMDPNNPIPHHLLGQAYRDLGRTEDAERELKIAAQLEERQTGQPRRQRCTRTRRGPPVRTSRSPHLAYPA